MTASARRGAVPGFIGKDPVAAATDASFKRGTAGIAYVVSDGRWGLRSWVSPGGYIDPTGSSVVLVAELRAVALLFEDSSGPDPAILLVDSKAAVEYLRSWQRGDTDRMPEGYSLRQRSGGQAPTLVRLALLMNGWHRILAVEHVPGHAGHPLNEAADSLASIARRRVPAGEACARASGLVEAFLSVWHGSAGRRAE